MEDIAIIGLYWSRDEAAISESQAKYGGFCKSIAMNILCDERDGEECVADTWLRAWNAMPPERPSVLRAFFGRIVRNLSISRYRREHAKKRFSGMELMLNELEECIPAQNSVERECEDAELTSAIERWLGTLPREERALFVRRYWYGEAVDALAREVGITPAKLASRMYRLRQRLKAALEGEGISI